MTNVGAQNTITSNLNYELKLGVELHSDIQVSVLDPSEQESKSLSRKVDSTSFVKNISLGTKSDERENCIKNINFRRTGICEDGNYQISINSTDSAGNTSETKIINIERDTVKPAKPKGGLELCGTSICLRLSESEVGVLLVVNNKDHSEIKNNNSVLSVQDRISSNKDYNFEIKYRDQAGNQSDTLQLSINIPPLGVGGADLNYEDPYLGFDYIHYLKFFNNWAEIHLNLKDELNLKSLDLHAPFITGIVNSFDSDDIDMYGFGLSKNMVVPLKAKITKIARYTDAAELCGVSIPTPQWSKDCISKKMGLNDTELAFEEAKIISSCGDTYLCFENLVNVEEYFEGVSFTLTNVELYVESNGANIISRRNCNIGQPCYDSNKRYWHDSEDAKWRLNFDRNQLSVGEEVKAYLKAYGSSSFIIDNESYNFDFGNSGWISEVSNLVKIPEQLNIGGVAVDPLDDPSCVGIIRSSDYGLRDIGDGWEFHDGVDFSGNTGCKITSIYKGSATSTWYAGNTVKVKHSDEFTTLYGHNDQYLGEYPRSVDTDEYIMSMGCSGRCTGTHLHLELYQNEVVINPRDYLNHIISIYED